MCFSIEEVELCCSELTLCVPFKIFFLNIMAEVTHSISTSAAISELVSDPLPHPSCRVSISRSCRAMAAHQNRLGKHSMTSAHPVTSRPLFMASYCFLHFYLVPFNVFFNAVLWNYRQHAVLVCSSEIHTARSEANHRLWWQSNWERPISAYCYQKTLMF